MNKSSSTQTATDAMTKTGFEIYRLWSQINIKLLSYKTWQKTKQNPTFYNQFAGSSNCLTPFVGWDSEPLL